MFSLMFIGCSVCDGWMKMAVLVSTSLIKCVVDRISEPINN
jgi:hypothetical protein